MSAKRPIEEMRAEFVGGPFDGERLTLKVVRESARDHRVLEVAYERPWISDEVEQDAAKELLPDGVEAVKSQSAGEAAS